MNKSNLNSQTNKSTSLQRRILHKQRSLHKKRSIFTAQRKNNQPPQAKCYFQQAKNSEFFQTENLKNSCRVWTTDESNPCHTSNDQNSINIAPIRSRKNIYTQPFGDYDQVKHAKSPVTLKRISNKSRKNIVDYFNQRMHLMQNLERRHQEEVSEAKSSMQKHQLTRLIKIQSLQKLYTVDRFKLQVRKDLKIQ